MKRSLRFLSGVLLLLAAGTTLSCRTALRRLPGPRSPEFPPPLSLSPALNATLLRLAAVDAGESDLQKDAEELLDAALATVESGNGRFRSISLFRRVSGPARRIRLPIRLRALKDLPILSEFRRSLRGWIHIRRRPHWGIMSELLRLVKRPIDRHYGYPDTGRPYASCAVVGNSGILLKSDHGDLIDGHDLVVRLNNARTAGYQRHVGFKTSVSFINSNVLHLCARRERCACHPYGDFVPVVMYVCQPAHFLDYVACNASHSAPLLVTDPRLDILCARIVKYYSLKRFVEETGKRPEEWGKAHDERMFHYSSGMQAVVLALGICDQVSVYGFGKAMDAKHHYHTNQKAELDLHDYNAEYDFYHDLVEWPEVIPFLKESGFKVPQVWNPCLQVGRAKKNIMHCSGMYMFDQDKSLFYNYL